MIGKVSKYDSLNEMGYIIGYDELTYFYHQNNIIGNKKIKEGDVVSFDYVLEKSENQLPYAVNIIKEEIPKGLKSYKEVYEILRKLPVKEQNKIPKQIIEKIYNNMDKNYEFKIEHIEDFENQKILEDTKELLAVIYRDYLASEEKTEIIIDVFANKRNKKIEEEKDIIHYELTVKEEKKWFLKFVDFIKSVLKK